MTVTLPGQIRPCPFCGAEMKMRERSSFHPTNQCWLTNMELDDFEYTAWNNRTAISSALTAASPVQEGWRAIETAPRDGTPILLACGDAWAVGEWKTAPSGKHYWEIAHDPQLGIVIPVMPEHATHWRPLDPLPAAPETTGVLPTGEREHEPVRDWRHPRPL